jgi:hypothetical protein
MMLAALQDQNVDDFCRNRQKITIIERLYSMIVRCPKCVQPAKQR